VELGTQELAVIRLPSLKISTVQRVRPVLEATLAMPTPHVRVLPAMTTMTIPIQMCALLALQHARGPR